MRLLPSDPDVETIVSRIANNYIDLQPDFQRGEVWSQAKQRRLIDSILRDWHVPPIHVIQHSVTKKQEVLDGQQRLAAIRDFVNGHFTVDGNIEPLHPEIQQLDGKRYSDLPPEWKRQFNQFPIRFFQIVDFEPSEPAELFFRLNQPVALTSAEQRNAFFGPIRSQVKAIVDILERIQFGFTNSRMALDDVVARMCLCIEFSSICQKITATTLADRYRSATPLSPETLSICTNAVTHFAQSATKWTGQIRLNKATLFSWLWLSACSDKYFQGDTPKYLALSIFQTEVLKSLEISGRLPDLYISDNVVIPGDRVASLVRLYHDRSSSRVSDVSSVISRDIFQWMTLSHSAREFIQGKRPSVGYLLSLERIASRFVASEDLTAVDFINSVIENKEWGDFQ